MAEGVLIINCSGQNSFGGRTEDTFVIENIRTLDELQEYIEKKQPIKCKEPTSYYKRWIIEKESLRERIVYLNNYLKIKRVNFDIMTKKEIEDLAKTTCKGCANDDGSLSGALRCGYDTDEYGECWNFRESFSFIKMLFGKSKFK